MNRVIVIGLLAVAAYVVVRIVKSDDPKPKKVKKEDKNLFI